VPDRLPKRYAHTPKAHRICTTRARARGSPTRKTRQQLLRAGSNKRHDHYPVSPRHWSWRSGDTREYKRLPMRSPLFSAPARISVRATSRPAASASTITASRFKVEVLFRPRGLPAPRRAPPRPSPLASLNSCQTYSKLFIAYQTQLCGGSLQDGRWSKGRDVRAPARARGGAAAAEASAR